LVVAFWGGPMPRSSWPWPTRDSSANPCGSITTSRDATYAGPREDFMYDSEEGTGLSASRNRPEEDQTTMQPPPGARPLPVVGHPRQQGGARGSCATKA